MIVLIFALILEIVFILLFISVVLNYKILITAHSPDLKCHIQGRSESVVII
jgi:hypothetical protein